MRTLIPRGRTILTLSVLLVLAAGFSCPPATAQSTIAAHDSTTKDRTPLGEALERLAATAEVSLVYDADLVDGHDATCAVDGDAPEATLRCLLDGTGLDFVQTSGGTYVVKEDVRQPPQHGAIRGVVRDANGSGPVPQAHVRLADAATGAVTDGDGRFRLSGLVAGPHTIVVSHVGYESRRMEVTVPPKDTVRPTLRLTPVPIAAEPVVVDAPTAEHLAPSRAHATLSADQLAQPSGAGTPSVAHAAGTLMGITTQAPYADLHVQGGASSDHEVRLDGVPVRNPATAGRLLGAFSPLALDGLTARKAGFGALRGNALSGIIELEHDLQRPDVQYATVQVDPVSLNGRAEGTVHLGETTATVMGAGRMGLWDLHQAYALSNLIDTWSVLDPVLTAAQLAADTSLAGGAFRGKRARPRSQFFDLHGAARFALAPTRHLYVSAYHGRSMLGTDLVTSAATPLTSGDAPQQDADTGITLPTSDRYEWTNTMAQARYETRLTDRATGTLQAALSRYDAASSYEVGQLQTELLGIAEDAELVKSQRPSGSRTANTVTELGLDGTLTLDLSDRDRLTLSGSVTSLGTQVRLENAFAGTVRHGGRATRLTVAGQSEMGIGSFTTLASSLRLTTHPGRGPVYAEPRAALRHHRPHTAIGEVALRIGGGLYRRFTTQFELSRDGATAVVPTAQVWMPVPETLTPPRTYHLATDATWQPHRAWTVGVEGYAKWQPHLLMVDYPALRTEGGRRSAAQVLAASRGRAYGSGLRVSYDGDGGSATLRYTYTHARRTFPGRFDGRAVPTPWADPHRLTLEGRVPLGDVFALDLRGNGIWGRRWGYRRAYYAYLSSVDLERTRTLPDLTRPAEHVLPPLYRVDASLEATHNWGNVAVTGRIGLVNVLDRANVADWGLRPTGNGTVTRRPRTLPGRRAVVSLKIHY